MTLVAPVHFHTRMHEKLKMKMFTIRHLQIVMVYFNFGLNDIYRASLPARPEAYVPVIKQFHHINNKIKNFVVEIMWYEYTQQ